MTPLPPSKALWAAELPRAAWSLASWPRHRAALAAAPRGDGRAVILLPGLFNADRSLWVMRRYLRGLGYRAETWGLGRNLGVRTVGAEPSGCAHGSLRSARRYRWSGSASAASSPG